MKTDKQIAVAWLDEAIEHAPTRVVLRITTTGGIRLTAKQKSFVHDCISEALRDIKSKILNGN